MPKTTIAERLSLIIKQEGHNAASFSKAIGEHPQTTNKILNNKNQPGMKYLQAVLSTFRHIDARWLILGE